MTLRNQIVRDAAVTAVKVVAVLGLIAMAGAIAFGVYGALVGCRDGYVFVNGYCAPGYRP